MPAPISEMIFIARLVSMPSMRVKSTPVIRGNASSSLAGEPLPDPSAASKSAD
jgi:hypothetical protein